MNIAASLRLFGDVVSRLPDRELGAPRVTVLLLPHPVYEFLRFKFSKPM